MKKKILDHLSLLQMRQADTKAVTNRRPHFLVENALEQSIAAQLHQDSQHPHSTMILIVEILVSKQDPTQDNSDRNSSKMKMSAWLDLFALTRISGLFSLVFVQVFKGLKRCLALAAPVTLYLM